MLPDVDHVVVLVSVVHVVSFTMSSSKLSYLQKYLSEGDSLPGAKDKEGGKAKKKKKKKSKAAAKESAFLSKYRARIIDDDEVFAENAERSKAGKDSGEEEDEEDKYETKEDQPQVAGFVDDRPEIVIMKERFTTRTFQPVIKVEDESEEEDGGPPGASRRRRHSSSDGSPPRRRRRHDSGSSDGGGGGGGRRRRHDSSSDGGEGKRRRRRQSSSPDNSLPRNAGKKTSAGADSDASPPRIKQEPLSDDERGSGRAQDLSPPRRVGSSQVEVKQEPLSDADNSPPRKQRRRRHSSSDASPPRRKRREDGSPDLSPPRRIKAEDVKREADSDGDVSPPRRNRGGDGDLSPPRSKKELMSKTLDGKKAGLQDAQALKKEMEALRRKDRRKFDDISDDVSGRGAETVVRGRLKAKEEERKRKQEENEITDEVKSKYSRWSKG